ncbi:3-dehydroquinate synthase [Candidatus Woesearchaeota archaeon]|nr:3-dehydroquinate synthase [Candidatus Woesearchaeota archaeon]
MWATVKVELPDIKNRTYEIVVGEDLLSGIRKFIKKNHKEKKIAVITDSNLSKIYKKTITSAFSGMNFELIDFAAGEKNKTRKTKQKLENVLFEKGFGRDSLIVALGGGVVGDLAGFVASTYARGVSYIQVPTSLLAMVDSSVGGKTGVDTPFGKNLVGSFYQPDKVFIDINFLDTLPEKEFINGLAELIKHAVIYDKELFYFLEKYTNEIINRDKEILTYLLKKSCSIKAEVVKRDEKEEGLRQILNFGHTIGHALEKISGYKLRHGFSVSIGISAEADISNRQGYLSDHELHRITGILESFALPVRIPENITYTKIIKAMKLDKKARQKIPRFVLVEKIGKVKSKKDGYSFNVDEKIIKRAVEECR